MFMQRSYDTVYTIRMNVYYTTHTQTGTLYSYMYVKFYIFVLEFT